MKNEYLFLSNEHRAIIEAYKPDRIKVAISEIEDTSLWITTLSLDGNNENSAKRLSNAHIDLMEYSPRVLSCESSEYYNRILFPLINKLERKLRKFLYLSAYISDSEKARESIKELESKTLGVIFDLLFIDQEFIKKMKKRINAKEEFDGKAQYSKNEIHSYLDELEEQTLWDTIVGEESVPTLRRRFRDVYSFRNDVMHAHNIGNERFGKAHYLFNKINAELDDAIDNLMESTEKEIIKKGPDINTAILSAVEAMDMSPIKQAIAEALRYERIFEDMYPVSLQSIDALLNNSALDKIRQQNIQLNRILQPNLTLQKYLDSLHSDLAELNTEDKPIDNKEDPGDEKDSNDKENSDGGI